MAATKFGFITQPNNTTQGYTLQGGAVSDYTLLGLPIYQQSTQLQNNEPILVGCLNSDGTLDTTSTVAVTIAIGTNPNSGTLSGTLTKNAVGGIASFTDLSINGTSLTAGTGYTITATGSLTTATSNPFNVVNLQRETQSQVSGVIGGNGQYVGPYRFRGHTIDLRQNELRLSIRGTFSATIQVLVVDPGVDQTASANQVVVASYTAPTSQVFVPGGNCDIYFFSSAYASGSATCSVYY